MGFEPREGFKFFVQNIWDKISIKLQLQFLLHLKLNQEAPRLDLIKPCLNLWCMPCV
jgi:hypothetical protein